MRAPRSSFASPHLLAGLAAAAAAWAGCGNTTTEFHASTTGGGAGGGGGGAGGATASSSSSSSSSTTTSSSSTTTSSSSSSTTSSGNVGGIISTSADSIIESETHVSVAPNGVVAVAWIAEQMGGNSTNGYVFSMDGGDTWTPVQQLASPNGQVTSDPVLAFDAQNNAYMTWIGFQFDSMGGAFDMHVYAAKAIAGSTTFGAPVEVAPPANTGVTFDKPWITVTNKNTVIITYAKTSTGGIYAARSTDGGATWGSSVIVEDGNFRNLVYPCVPAVGDRIWAVYHAGGGIGMRWSDDDGVSWPTNNKVAVAATGESPAFDDPTCVTDGTQVWVSYGLSNDPFSADASPKLFAIRLAHSPDGGATIDSRTDAHDAAAGKMFLHPQLARDESGRLHLVYYAGQANLDTAGTYRRSVSPDGGQTWQPSTAVRDPVTFLGDRASKQWLGDYVGLGWAGGSVFTSYVDNTSGSSHIAFSREATP